MNPAIPAIEVVNIRKQFHLWVSAFQKQTVTALDGVSFSVAAGEACAVVGPNGSGKTTLLRILSTVLLPCSGTVRIQGHPLSAERQFKALTGVVPARVGGFGAELTARENLEFYSALRRMPRILARRRIDELVDQFGLGRLGDKPFRVYSTGQRQRLNLARALLHDPEVLLWDEPSAGLDPWVARDFRAWVRAELIERCRKTVLMATNQPADVEAICEKAVYLKEGKRIWTGPAGEFSRKLAAREET